MKHIVNDGGRKAAGFKGSADDCVTRSIAIVSGRPYAEIYHRLAQGNGGQRASIRTAKKSASARNGIYVQRKWFKDYMRELGFDWTPTMLVGQGCRVHLKADELPPGKLVVAVSKHYTAVIDGELHDTFDCSRNGTRCVYGYWQMLDTKKAPPPTGSGASREK